jgi:hypothetical protein
MREAGEPSTGVVTVLCRECVRPPGDGHGRTTRGPAQRWAKPGRIAKGRANEGCPKSAARDSIKAGAPHWTPARLA